MPHFVPQDLRLVSGSYLLEYKCMYFVYILTNKYNTTFYIGVTNNLIRRVYEHQQKYVSGFTSKYNLKKLVYFEQYENVLEAK